MPKSLPAMHRDPLVAYFHKHVVPIYFAFKRGTETDYCLVTSFVMSVSNQWFLITAAHVIADVRTKLSQGFVIQKCRLIDCMGGTATHIDTIPFEYSDAVAVPLGYDVDPTCDYGVIYLDQHYRNLLEKNGITALNEESWEKQPSSFDFFKLLGVPAQLSEATGEKVHITSTLHDVTAIAEKPEAFHGGDTPMFYGRIGLEAPLTDIAGMSGGPLFGFRLSDNGELKYWLVAIQSRWLPSSRLVAACLTRPLGTFLKQFMAGKFASTP